MEGQTTWDLLWAIIVMVAVLALCYFVTKFIATKASGRSGGSAKGTYMRILDRLVISRNESILLVEVGGQVLLIGVTGQNITTLTTVEDLQILPQDEKQPTFMEALRSIGKDKMPAKPRKDVEEYIKAGDGSFGSILKEKAMGKKPAAEGKDSGEEFSAQLDEMNEKMRARNEKLRGRRDS